MKLINCHFTGLTRELIYAMALRLNLKREFPILIVFERFFLFWMAMETEALGGLFKFKFGQQSCLIHNVPLIQFNTEQEESWTHTQTQRKPGHLDTLYLS